MHPIFREDRRSEPRLHTVYRLEVADRTGRLDGYVLDLSRDGMRVRLRGGDLASTRRLWVEFPRWLRLGAGMEVEGRFVWVRPDHETGEVEGGFSFARARKRDAQMVGELLEALARAAEQDGLPVDRVTPIG